MSRLFFAQSLRSAARDVAKQPSLTRSFSSLPGLRPSMSTPASIFARRPATLVQTPFAAPTVLSATTTIIATAAEQAAADIVPTWAISAHPALMQSQIRCGPRRYQNMNRPSRLIRNRRVGFLTRMKTKDGRKLLARRKAKGRKRLGAA